MKHIHFSCGTAASSASLAVLLVVGWPPATASADDLAAASYLRVDSDRTTVVSPRVHAAGDLAESTVVDATYAADVWTSASIDIRTSASKAPVTEQRDELDVAVTHTLEDVSLHAGYRLSIENDYDSNGLSASAGYDFADNAANLTLSLGLFHDIVGRSGQPEFARRLDTVNVRLSFTQVLDPRMLAVLTYEGALLDGYQGSPYRFVGFGGTGFGCTGARECLQERVPEERSRHAFAAMLRRALADAFSAGATYRFYLDDWGLRSHTALVELGLNAGEHSLVTLGYRFYTQSAADFYRARYPTWSATIGHATRDRELSATSNHHVSLGLSQTLVFDRDGRVLVLSLDTAGTLFRYAQFVGLSRVRALELTVALLLTI